MGTTRSSLHILRHAAMPPQLGKDVQKAYAKIGFGPASSDLASKIVIVRDTVTAPFISVFDSDCAQVDTGELKQLAVTLSKRLSAIAIVASILDSDSFELVVFQAGKQVDAVLSQPPASGSRLKILKGKKRLEVWEHMFLWPEISPLMSAMSAADPGIQAEIADRMRAFEERMADAGKVESAFADDHLARWCAVVGLDPALALTPFAEIARGSDAGASQFGFSKLEAEGTSSDASSTEPTRSIAAPQLAWLRADEACPYHRYYPAPWPIDPQEEQSCRWLITSSAGGLDGLTLELGIENAAGVQVEEVGAVAFPFYNGQITSMTPIATSKQDQPFSGGQTSRFRFAPFGLPPVDPQTRKQILIELRLRFKANGDKRFTFAPTLLADPSGVSLELPPLTLKPVTPGWQPLVLTQTNNRQVDARRLLNSPYVLSATAMLDDDGASVRNRVREFAQRWFAAVQLPPGSTVDVHTQTHMSPTSFRVSKSSKRHGAEALQDDKLWKRLLEAKTEYHTVSLAMHAPGLPHAVGGLMVQAALQGETGRLPGSLLTVAAWVLNEPRVLDLIGTTPEHCFASFEAWIERERPAQAWIAQAAWIPEFDTYDAYRQTVYEEAADLDWFRSNMNGKLALRDWAERHLRFVSPRMWLGASLADKLDLAALRTIADVEVSPLQVHRVSLKAGESMAALEKVLSTILPPSR